MNKLSMPARDDDDEVRRLLREGETSEERTRRAQAQESSERSRENP